MTDKLKIVLHGATGRMGRAIVDVASGDAGVEMVAVFDPRAASESTLTTIDDLKSIERHAVVIDFSVPQAIDGLLRALQASRLPLVCGTTGLSLEQHDGLRTYSADAPVFYAENMSYGIAVLTRLLATAGEFLGRDSDIGIVETHHRNKKDAPSGTALALARAIDRGEGREVPIHSIRAGGVPGDHQVIFAADEEVITLSHRALSRDVFARGSLRAARFVRDRGPGMYRMQDLVEAEREALITKG